MKRLLSLALALPLCLGLATPALALGGVSTLGTETILSTSALCASVIKSDGSLWMWGCDSYGQLGVGQGAKYADGGAMKTHICEVPVKVMDNVRTVSLGYSHSAAIKTDNSLWMWGDNTHGELGIGITGNALSSSFNPIQTIPVKVMDNVSAVSCGSSYTAAIKGDGSLWVWGTNGQSGYLLGNGGVGNETVSPDSSYSVQTQTIPMKIMDDVSAVCCGQYSAAAIKKDGSLWMWGRNREGQLGTGSTRDSNIPVKVMDDVAAVSCGSWHTAAIKTDGSLWVWGSNFLYELGNGTNKDSSVPIKIMDDVAAVSCGADNTAVIKADGSLWVWGSNEHGQLGNGGEGDQTQQRGIHNIVTCQSVPVKIMDDVCAVSCGSGNFTAAIKTDGSLWTWGIDSYGQLGNGSAGSVSVPAKVMEGISLSASATVPTSPTVAGFSDVHESDYFADAVVWAKETGVTGGTSATTFSPNNTVTRADAMTFLWRGAGSPEPESLVSPFSDVTDAGAYYYKAVLWAAENGITSGVSATDFGIKNTLSYDQILAFLFRAAGETDVGSDWSAAAVNWAAENGLTAGLTFTAKGNCPRSDVIYCLWKQMA